MGQRDRPSYVFAIAAVFQSGSGTSDPFKKYSRAKAVVDGVEQKVFVSLSPLNPDYETMSFDLEMEDKPNMVGTFCKVISL